MELRIDIYDYLSDYIIIPMSYSYHIIGGVLGSFVGHEYALSRRYNVFIASKYVADMNYGYLMYGSVLGVLAGGVFGQLIKLRI